MVKIVGFWDLGYSDPLRESQQFDYLVRDYGIDAFVMNPVSGIKASTLEEHDDISDIFSANPNIPAIFIDENGGTPLKDFVHPADCLYVFGKAGYSPLAYKRDGDLSVYIPTTNNIGGMWAHQAAAVILNDRFQKSI